MRILGGLPCFHPVPLRDLLVGPSEMSSFATGVSPRAGPARPRGGGKSDTSTPARGSSSPHAAEPRIHRPRRRAPCQVRGCPPRAVRRSDDIPAPLGRRAASSRTRPPLRGPPPSCVPPSRHSLRTRRAHGDDEHGERRHPRAPSLASSAASSAATVSRPTRVSQDLGSPKVAGRPQGGRGR